MFVAVVSLAVMAFALFYLESCILYYTLYSIFHSTRQHTALRGLSKQKTIANTSIKHVTFPALKFLSSASLAGFVAKQIASFWTCSHNKRNIRGYKMLH